MIKLMTALPALGMTYTACEPPAHKATPNRVPPGPGGVQGASFFGVEVKPITSGPARRYRITSHLPVMGKPFEASIGSFQVAASMVQILVDNGFGASVEVIA